MYKIGDEIKSLRQHFNITQKEMCDGICTQAFISKIETNTVLPTAPILYELSKRLGVDINYFFNEASNHRENYIDQFKDFINKEMEKTNYKEVLEAVKFEKRNPIFLKPHLKQFLLWREAICLFHLYKNEKDALQLIDQALQLEEKNKKIPTEIEIDILSSKAIILSMSNKTTAAYNIYNDLLRLKNKLPLVPDKRLIIRIYYNASRNSYDLKEYDRTSSLAEKGIKYCVNEKSLYLLPDLYFIKGMSIYNLNINHSFALKYLKNALWLYELESSENYIKYVSEEIEKIEMELKEDNAKVN